MGRHADDTGGPNWYKPVGGWALSGAGHKKVTIGEAAADVAARMNVDLGRAGRDAAVPARLGRK